MNSLGPIQNRQEPAQMANVMRRVSCNGGNACQSVTQASALSPRLVVVRRNHNPSPSSPRSRAFWPEPGFFFAPSGRNVVRCAKPCALDVNRLAPGQHARNMRTTHITDRGSERCKSQNYSQGFVLRRFWPDASGMTLNAPVQVRRQGPLSRASATETFLPVRLSARVQGHCATTSGSAEASATQSTNTISHKEQVTASLPNTPARGFSSGGFFVANLRGCAPHTHEEGTGYVQ